jgi:hypothetical protein
MPHTLPSHALEHILDHVLEHIRDDVHDKHHESADVLAVAFTDRNGNHTYEPGTDKLIASLLDTNHDHVVSVGDRIHFGSYPTSADVDGPRGHFKGHDLFVEAVDFASSSVVEVQTALGSVSWADIEGTRAFESFATATADGVAFSAIDRVNPGDLIFADPSVQGPGLPDTPVDAFGAPGNQGFLDVLIFV